MEYTWRQQILRDVLFAALRSAAEHRDGEPPDVGDELALEVEIPMYRALATARGKRYEPAKPETYTVTIRRRS